MSRHHAQGEGKWALPSEERSIKESVDIFLYQHLDLEEDIVKCAESHTGDD